MNLELLSQLFFKMMLVVACLFLWIALTHKEH